MAEIDSQVAFPTLTADQIAVLRGYGEVHPVMTGDILLREGPAPYDFFVILDGEVEVFDDSDGEERILSRRGAGQFLGEINMLTGEAGFVTARVCSPGSVIRIHQDRLRQVIAEVPDVSDVILNAFLLRRVILMQGAKSTLKIIGSRYSRDTLRIRQFASRNRIPHTWIDVERDAAAEELLTHFNVRPDETPVVIWHGTRLLRNPDMAELGELMGMHPQLTPDLVADLIVVGSGPAGLAASVYGASEGLRTVNLESVAIGGQAGTSTRIENYLGFPAGLSGAELTSRAAVQARKFGADISVPNEAVGLHCHGSYFVVELADGSEVSGRSVIIATGARYRKLDLPKREEFEGRGIYYAATEMEAEICKGEEVLVVGGGNSAGQGAVFLARQVRKVYIVIRGEDLGASMSRYLVDRIGQTENIEVLTMTQVQELRGERNLEGVVVETRGSGARTLPVRALFTFIGAEPYTDWLRDKVELDPKGFIITGRDLPEHVLGNDYWHSRGREPYLLETSVPGIFAVGDVRSASVKRIAAAVGEGSIAVRLVHQYLADGGILETASEAATDHARREA